MAEQPTQTEIDFSIVSAQLTIEALRDSGYKDTDHALAELIDNSVEAGARTIEVVAVETAADPTKRWGRATIGKIAVADDGEGMDGTTLRRALKFGDGTRLDRSSRGIGRFGVGLPQSSISQCKRVDVWTWQNGPDNAYHCYLDLDEVKAGRQDVPMPVADPVPTYWRTLDCTAAATGTLVVWSELDRVTWRGGRKTLEHTATLCGRVYRKYLDGQHQHSIDIRLLHVMDEGTAMNLVQEQSCLPNDPLYLMASTSTPPPFSDSPMFRQYNEHTWSIRVGDTTGDVHVRCSMARAEAINEEMSTIAWPESYSNPGSSPWGKHAEKNKGVSIVRAKRELQMSLAWVNNYEPEERWWSVEVEFDPILDEVFGVVNNKQHAHTFVNGAGFDWNDAADGETRLEFLARLEEDGDPRFHLVEIWEWMDNQIKSMRRERKKIRKGTRPRHPQTQRDIEDVATDVVKEQVAHGDKGVSDEAPKISIGEKRRRLEDSMRDHRVDLDIAADRAAEIADKGRRVLIQPGKLGPTTAFFDVESVGDVIQVWLNEAHPVYEHLIDVLRADEVEFTAEDLLSRLQKADFTLRMLLVAWARYEDKLPSGNRQEALEMRIDWGREARRFLDVIES